MENTIIDPNDITIQNVTTIMEHPPEAEIRKPVEQICCIELENNNHLYIRYESTWKIRDLIKELLNHKEFKKLYPGRDWQTNSTSTLPLFDLHLIMFRALRPETETKVDFDIEIGNLHDKGLLKNERDPFFIFKDNRNKGNLILSYEDKRDRLKVIAQNNFEAFTMYQNYLPRVGLFNIINSHPELIEYYQSSKQGLNNLSRFNINPIISQSETLDWFNYDDESMNCLASYETKTFPMTSVVKFSFDGKKDKVFFEDKYVNLEIPEKDLKSVLVSLSYVNKNKENTEDIITKKFQIKQTTTPKELIMQMKKKLELVNITFDPDTKILKAKSINDYIFDVNMQLIKYAYITDCINKNEEPEYFIIDNPLGQELMIDQKKAEMALEEDDNGEIKTNAEQNIFSATRNFGSVEFLEDENVKKLFNVASFKQPENFQRVSQKTLQITENKNNPQDPLDLFVKSIANDLNEQAKLTIEETQQIISDTNAIVIEEPDQDWGISIINQSMMSQAFHPISKREDGHHLIVNETFINVNDSMLSPLISTPTSFTSRKRKQMDRKPNIFIEKQREICDTLNMMKFKGLPIRLSDIDRPFSIIFRNAYINQIYQSFPFDKHNTTTVFVYHFQIVCGESPFSKPKEIKWIFKEGNDQYPCFNKRIYFDLPYSSIPTFATLLIKLRLNVYDRTGLLKSNKTIGWRNFRLFDHKKYLLSGIHKVNLFSTPFGDDSYFCYLDTYDLNPNAVYFEIDSFALPVYNEIYKLEKFDYDIKSLMISQTDQQKINDIIEKNPFDELNNYDKEILWANRFKLSKIPKILPKLLLCVDYANPSHPIELEKILAIADLMSPSQSIELLTGKYLHESIRKYAVKCLSQASPHEIKTYLFQLVQGLKYELMHENDLAKYLLSMAISYPLTIGHSLFWYLRSEMGNPRIHQRFGLYLEVFLTKIKRNLIKIYEEEIWLISGLSSLAKQIKNKKKDDRIKTFKDALKNLNESMKEKGDLEISLPINFKYRIKSFKVEECKILNTKKKPLWLVMESADKYGEDFVMMYKIGEDLRMDIISLHLFKTMHSLWLEKDIRLRMSLYDVVNTSYGEGMIEIVKNSVTLSQIIKDGGPFKTKSSLKKWMDKTIKIQEDEFYNNYFLSCVFYTCALLVFGIGDRCTDNVLFKRNGEMFHIDFKHFLGYYKTIQKFQVRILFTKQFQSIMGGESGKVFKEFEEKLWETYAILRKRSVVLLTLLNIMLITGLPELTKKSIKFLDKSLCLDLNEEQAHEFIQSSLEKSISEWSIDFNF